MERANMVAQGKLGICYEIELRLTELEMLEIIRVLRSHPDMTETEARTAARVSRAFGAALTIGRKPK